MEDGVAFGFSGFACGFIGPLILFIPPIIFSIGTSSFLGKFLFVLCLTLSSLGIIFSIIQIKKKRTALSILGIIFGAIGLALCVWFLIIPLVTA